MNRWQVFPDAFRLLAVLVIAAIVLPLALPGRSIAAAGARLPAPAAVPGTVGQVLGPEQTFVAMADQDSEIAPQMDTPWGDETTLYVWRNTTGNNMWWSMFHFDLAAVPAGATVVSATVRLYVTASDGVPVSVHRITAAWDEHVDSWSTMSSHHDPVPFTTFSPGRKNHYSGIDVTALAQAWLDGAYPNDGILLKPTQANAESRYASKETDDAGQWPYLELVVELPNRETVADDFDPNTAFGGSDGSRPWLGDWLEWGEANGPTAGQVQAASFPDCSSGACLRIFANRQDLTGRGVSRAVNLSGAASAMLAFSFRRAGQGGQVNLEVSADGGAQWQRLHTYALDGSDSAAVPQNFNLLPYASADTRIRFIGWGVTRLNGTGLFVDDVSIVFVRQGIGNRVWDDRNRDGVQDAGEPGLAAVTVQLYNSTCGAIAGAPFRSTVTDGAGNYVFTRLSAGAYCVRVDPATLPLSYTLTTNNAPLDVTLAADQYFDSADFGYSAAQADDRLAVGAYAPCADTTWLQALAQVYGATITSQNPATCGYTVQVAPANLAALQAAVVADPHARHAAPDVLAHGEFTPNDPDYNNASKVYGPQQINAPAAWDVTTGDPNLSVAIVDTGIDRNHPEFTGRLLPGYDFVNKDADPTDDNGHGTHVAGIAAAGINNGIGLAGIAGNVKILPVKVLAANNTGWWSDVADGVTWAVDQGAKVINMSLNGLTDSLALRDAVAYATSKNVMVVVAAGNGATSELSFPASYDEVLSVGGTTNTGIRYTLSNYGPNVDAMAPGSTVWSSYWTAAGGSSYRFMNGTSMAAPHAAGLATLLFSVNPNLTASQVRNTILSTATDMDVPGVDALTGYGLINAAAAVAAVTPAVFVTPTTSLTATLLTDVHGNDLVDPGDTLRYVVTVANGDTQPLNDVVISATVPVHTSYVISSTRLSGIPVRDDTPPKTTMPLDEGGLNIGAVPPHNSSAVSFDAVVESLPRGVYAVVGQATVQAGSTQSLQAVTPVAGTLLQAAVDKASAQISQTLTYTFTSDYLGSDLLSSAVVTAAVPAGTSYVAGSANAGGTQSGGVVTWNLGSNAAGVPGNGTGSSGGSGTATAVAASANVTDPANAVGAPNGTLAALAYSANFLTLDLGTIVPPGTSITIRMAAAKPWSEEATVDGGTDGTIFTVPSDLIPSTTLSDHPYAVTQPGSIRYLRIRWNGSVPASELYVDAVSFATPIIPTRTTTLTAAPTLVTAGSRVTVTQVLTASQDLLNVTPTALTITGTNGVTATWISGPTPLSATVGITGTTFTWVYTATAGSNAGQLTFDAQATGGGYTWPRGQSNSVIVAPPLTFGATVAGAPAGGGPIRTTGFIRDAGGLLPSNASNTPVTGLFSTLGDRIWNDRDGDGIQDAAETGLGGAVVQLTAASGSVRTTPTDANGWYDFTNLLAGVYTVTVDTASVSPEYDLLTTRYPVVVTLRDGEDFDGAAVGLKAQATAVGDTIWYDADADGRQDAGEPGLGNVTLDLYFDDGDGVFNPAFDTLVDTTTSDAAGAYRLNAPVAGGYFVNVTDAAGLLTGLAHTIGPQSLTDPSPAIPLAVGQHNCDVDFGYVRPPQAGHGIIGDLVWADGNGDGVREINEPILIGVEVCATPTAGGTPICGTTDNNGRYLLEAPAGEYSVASSGQPAGLLPSTPSRLTVNLTAEQQQLAVDFGFTAGAAPLGGIGGTLWQDLPVNGVVDGIYTPTIEPGLPEVSVGLIRDLDDSGTWNGSEPYIATFSTVAGDYHFAGLPAGDYLVRVTDTRRVLRRFAVSAPGPLAGASADHQNQPQPYPVTLAPGGTDTTADFGYREYEAFGVSEPPPPGLIGDLVWLDADADGQYDPNHSDLSLPGVTVAARDAGGAVIATTTTGSDGKYLFTDLEEGDYTVRVTDAFGVLAAFIATVPTAAPAQDNTNRAQPYPVTLGLDPVNYTVDFGYTQPAAVSGFVFYDQNANHAQDPGETCGLTGVDITLTSLTTGLTRVTTTAGGVYTFTGLLPGGYQLAAPEVIGGALLTTEPVITVMVGVGGASGTGFGYIAPTAVRLAGFAAVARGDAVWLTWQMTLAGRPAPAFYVWRSAGGASWKQLPAAPQGPAAGDAEMATYVFSDTAIERGVTYLYRLESTTGESFGPWPVRVPAADDVRRFLPLVGR